MIIWQGDCKNTPAMYITSININLIDMVYLKFD